MLISYVVILAVAIDAIDNFSLVSSGIVILVVSGFTYVYYKIEQRGSLSQYIDKALEKDETKKHILK